MPPHMSVLIIHPDRDTRRTIEGILEPFSDIVKIVGSVSDLAEGTKAIQQSLPTVVILGVSDIERGVAEIKQVLTLSPRISVFVTAREKSSDWILKLMRAGATEYFLEPLEAADLKEALQKLGRIWLRPIAPAAPTGKIITIYNPVGGMGTTTVAVNLAANLSAENGKVALIDLNLFSGDVSSFLDLNPTYTLSSVTSNITRLDASFLKSVMTRHSSGVYVLTEPSEVEECINITPEQVHRLLGFFRGVFDFVILDTGGHMAGANITCFENTDILVFNTVLNLPALKNTKRYLTALARLGLSRNKIKLLVNRYQSNADIKVADAERVLDFPVFHTIPNEYRDVIASINKGIPVVTLYPRSNVSKAISKLATELKETMKVQS